MLAGDLLSFTRAHVRNIGLLKAQRGDLFERHEYHDSPWHWNHLNSLSSWPSSRQSDSSDTRATTNHRIGKKRPGLIPRLNLNLTHLFIQIGLCFPQIYLYSPTRGSALNVPPLKWRFVRAPIKLPLALPVRFHISLILSISLFHPRYSFGFFSSFRNWSRNVVNLVLRMNGRSTPRYIR